MCRICEIAATNSSYDAFLAKMLNADIERIEATTKMAATISLLNRAAYSSIKWPVKLSKPMFEARTAFAVPNNYYQSILLDDGKLGVSFAHGAMRSVFFTGSRLLVLSKNVNSRDALEFFTSFLLLHLEPSEYKIVISGDDVTISADVEKGMRNLVTGKMEKRRVKFLFRNMPVTGRIISKEQAAASAHFKSVYGKFGGARAKAASMDMEGYAITVPHFSPHPFMLQLHKEFGYSSNREFQEHTIDYFKAHVLRVT